MHWPARKEKVQIGWVIFSTLRGIVLPGSCQEVKSANSRLGYQNALDKRTLGTGNLTCLVAQVKGQIDGKHPLTEHYIWRAIEQASRIADKIDERWPGAQASIRRKTDNRTFSQIHFPFSSQLTNMRWSPIPNQEVLA